MQRLHERTSTPGVTSWTWQRWFREKAPFDGYPGADGAHKMNFLHHLAPKRALPGIPGVEVCGVLAPTIPPTTEPREDDETTIDDALSL